MARRNPLIYQINTWVWLNDLSKRFHRHITLGNVPEEVLDELASWNFDYIWLMGIWQRSPRARQIVLRHPQAMREYQAVLPELTPEKVIGSAYAIHRYEIEPTLGGREELATFRKQMRERGVGILLDYVPNHVAVDHNWVYEAPDALVRGSDDDVRNHSSSYYFVVPNTTGMLNGKRLVLAHGRDPNFPAWIDTAQVDAFSPRARALTRDVLADIASQCDGVRCDMAMLLVNRIFARTWWRSEMPDKEFWTEIIPEIKAQYPDFIFMAEVYWDMESELLGLGFDYCYDKRLYDRLKHENAATVRDHLLAALSYQERMVRFIENHDEDRAMEGFGMAKSVAAAILVTLLPGATLMYEGQFEGRRIRLPVQLGERPQEAPNAPLISFYRQLVAEAQHSAYHEGAYIGLGVQPILGTDPGEDNMIAFAWAHHDEWRVICANYADHYSKARVMLPFALRPGQMLRFENVLNPGETFTRAGDELPSAGLPLELSAYQVKVFRVSRV
jgi:hypothetical protein